MIKCKSIYRTPEPEDGERVFVDRLWPEGISTRDAALHRWLQELAPSYELWRYSFSVEQWPEYKERYWQELAKKPNLALLRELLDKSRDATVTLLYGTRNDQYNNAVALKQYVEQLDNRPVHS